MTKTLRAFLRDFWTLAAPYWSSEERWAARGLGIAALGNGRLLAAEDAEGTLVELFWPHPGLRHRIPNEYAWLRRPEGPPPGAGIFAGLDVRGRVRWLRDASEVVPLADLDSVAAGTEFRFADGIVVTPSHNPPQDGGFKYNPFSGGPADTEVTDWVQRRANDLLRREYRRGWSL